MAKIKFPKGAKGLIFDLDGTLADTMPMHIDCWILAGRENGVNITAQMINDYAGMASIELVRTFNKKYGWTLDPQKIQAQKNALYVAMSQEPGTLKPIRPVYELAQSQVGIYKMSVGTGSIRSNAVHALRTLNIMDWFEGIVTADDIQKPKPHPETFLKCAELMKVHPKDCHVFEDGQMGIEAALAARMSVTDIRDNIVYMP